jgi:hypothetical protein
MNIEKILEVYYPNAEWVTRGDKYSDLDWLDSSPKPTENELRDLWPDVLYKVRYMKVERQRQSAYQQESDPLMAKYLRDEIPKEEWLAKVAEIKERYPYPERESE